MQYTQDYDEHLPAGFLSYAGAVYPDGSTHTESWRVAIYPYVKSVQVFNCPSADSYLEWKGRIILLEQLMPITIWLQQDLVSLM